MIRPLAFSLLCCGIAAAEPLSVSGIYPSLAVFNGQGECGIGAVVPWAGRLWWITYPPHQPKGGPDKLYSVKPDMSDFTIHAESVGGTHASRMIHKESNQLVIGPYFISAEGKVRAADVKTKLVGRLTAVMRHLTDPANLVYFYDMEGALYEVNVHTLDVKKLFEKPVLGWHGKGAYTAQGRVVVANNGELKVGGTKTEFLAKLPPESPEDAGVLAEWDGKEWRILARRQFLDVTGPGGIHGAPDDKAPLWTVGWDKRSLILKLLDGGEWSTFRMPKGSYTFDPQHGWYTEWPRIRDLDDGKYLAVLHGQMFDFPGTFSRVNTAGIRPICTHLRYVPDLTQWGDRLVIASDDTSIMKNPLAGQSQSNLWFGKKSELTGWGPVNAWGGVWIGDEVKGGVASDPFLVAGYARKVLHLSHRIKTAVTFTIEADAEGDGHWAELAKVEVPAQSYRWHVFDSNQTPEWVRIVPDRDCQVSAYFHLSNVSPHGLAKAMDPFGHNEVLVRPAKENRNLQVKLGDKYWEVDENLAISVQPVPEEVKAHAGKWAIQSSQPAIAGFTVGSVRLFSRDAEIAPIEPSPPLKLLDFEVDAASVIVKDHSGRPWRLPKTDEAFDALPARGMREIQSERFVANWHGSFYEIPRQGDADWPDMQKMKPVCTHRLAISDYCTWCGLLVLAGGITTIDFGRTVDSPDQSAHLWFGKSDDLWRLGKTAGHGGPWKDTVVKPGVPSDPYLMTNYDHKTLRLSHDAEKPVVMTVEVDFLANGTWREYQKFTVPSGQSIDHEFPVGYSAHWLRVISNAPCKATAQLVYE